MARSSITDDANDALELFLDALSNTFGGIVFIALLVCVQLQIAGHAIDGTANRTEGRTARKLLGELRGIKRGIEVAEQRLERLQKRIRDLSKGSDPELARRYNEQSRAESKLREDLKRQHSKKDELDAKVSRLGKMLDHIGRTAKSLSNRSRTHRRNLKRRSKSNPFRFASHRNVRPRSNRYPSCCRRTV